MLNSLRSFQVGQMEPWRFSSRLNLIINVTGVALLVSAPFWLHELFGVYDEDASISLFAAIATVALILVVDYVLILFCTHRHSSLRRLMILAVLAKVAAAGLYISMVVRVYGYTADVVHYFGNAEEYTISYQQTGIMTVPDPLFGTNFPPFLTHCIFLVSGISLPVATVIFASMSFWGAYFIYRAFCISFPESTRFDLVATLVFLFPSCVFWTASISKDAIVMLGSGLAIYGFAKMYHRVGVQGFLFLAGGLTVIMTVRPHMAGILAIAYIFPYVFGGHRTGISGIAIKVIGLPVLAALTWMFVARGATYSEMQDISQGRSAVLRMARNNAVVGGSTYGDSLAARMALAPFLLFRPFPFEVHNVQAALASLEGLGLLALFWRRRRVLYATLRGIRSNAVAMFLVLYTAEFTIIYAAATTNFGLLNRQRVMLIPFAIMLFLGDLGPQQQVAPVPLQILRRRRSVAVRVRAPISGD